MKRTYTLAALSALVIGGAPIASAQATGPAAPAPRPKPAQLPSDSVQVARKYALWFYTGQSDSLFAHMDSTTRDDYKAADGVADDIANFALNVGSELNVVKERFVTRLGRRQYWRTARFTGVNDPFLVRLVIGPHGEFLGMGFGSARQPPPIDP